MRATTRANPAVVLRETSDVAQLWQTSLTKRAWFYRRRVVSVMIIVLGTNQGKDENIANGF